MTMMMMRAKIFFMGTYQTYLYLVHRLDLNLYFDVGSVIFMKNVDSTLILTFGNFYE